VIPEHDGALNATSMEIKIKQADSIRHKLEKQLDVQT